MDWVIYKQQKFIAHILEVGEFRIKMVMDAVSGEGSLSAFKMVSFTASSPSRRDGKNEFTLSSPFIG
jgi:hypothetical protein